MRSPTPIVLILAALSYPITASPLALRRLPQDLLLPRVVTSLNEDATAEAHPRDNSAVRAFSNVQISTNDGHCLTVDPLSGDFRANLNPVKVAACSSTEGQGWDVITSGVHNNAPGFVLFVNTLTQACLNFDPRRAAGNEVITFSCGGRADGSGGVTNAQLFALANPNSPGRFVLTPQNSPGSCLSSAGDNILGVTSCSATDADTFFTIGGAGGSNPVPAPANTPAASDPAPVSSPTAPAEPSVPACIPVASPTTTTITPAVVNDDTQVAEPSDSNAPANANSNSATDPGFLPFNPTTAVPVKGAGGTLKPDSVAESQKKNAGDTRFLQSAQIIAPNNKCLAVNPVAGDFRENLIPIQLVDCVGAPNEKWDLVTAGVHNNQKGTTLLVSSLTNGCISFDGRRAPGNQVTVFSCGGRGDGSGQTDASQLFAFNGQTTLALSPLNTNNQTCLAPDGGVIDVANCANDGSQQFTIVTSA